LGGGDTLISRGDVGPVGETIVKLEDWFLTPSERGNDGSEIDRRHASGEAWTTGNDVDVRIDGAVYFRRLHETLAALVEGASVWFTDWEGHADERLAGPGTELGSTLVRLAKQGVHVRGLLWRSHPRAVHFSEQDNLRLASRINREGGLLVLDQRVRRGGSHHQKLLIVRHGPNTVRGGDVAPSDVGFIGGLDICHGRRDDRDHAGDPQTIELDRRYGARPPWHDLQLELRGPAVDDLSWSFRERWVDPAPLDHRNPLRAAVRRLIRQPRTLPTLPMPPTTPSVGGTHAVQVLRTYPSRRPRYPFAPDGERSVARAFLKAVARARSLVTIEDQYFWSIDAANALASALRRHAGLRVVIVVPRYPDRDGRLSGAASRYSRNRAIDVLRAAGGERVAVYDLENRMGTPIYVHAKVCVIDDVWLEVGSDNLNRRSWTHDSELACAVIDDRVDGREPLDPGGLGDRARTTARDTRLALWAEHLGRAPGEVDDLIDPHEGFDQLRRAAQALEAWTGSDRVDPRPPGHLTPHDTEPVDGWHRPVARLTYRTVLDPDGRPLRTRRARRY
jgi:phosphatidylserine/phosphatidylglycerophosphate/cardiolipin synthase-like enzyme